MADCKEGYEFAIDPANARKNARLAVFSVVNAVATSLSDMERAHGMKPAEMQIYMLIGLALVQRALRKRPMDANAKGMEPLTADDLSGISRRKLADLTGLSREAIRRAVLRLMERSLVMEKERGALVHVPGSLQQLDEDLPVERFLQPYITMMNELDRAGVIKVARKPMPGRNDDGS